MPIVNRMPGANKKADFADWIIVVACGLALTFAALLLATMPLVRALSGSRDYLVYWATGQQLVHHANPYDAAQMGHLEHQAGLTVPGSYFMRNPPWALPLAYPLGFVPERIGALPWSLLLAALLIVSVKKLRATLTVDSRDITILGYCFPPALIAVIMGQSSIFALVGLVLFLGLWEQRPYWAGSSLWLCALKPHLLLLFGLVLLIWIVRSRSYKIVIGFAATLAVSCALTLWIDPAALQQYLQWARHSGISAEFIPCLAVLLRQSLRPATGWLAFVPAVLGCGWAVWFYWSRRDRWNWLRDGSVLVLVSLLLAPYCWIWDQALAMPAVLLAACHTASRRILAALGALYLAMEVMQFSAVPYSSPLYLWPAVAWLAWNQIALRQPRAIDENFA